MTPEEQTLLMWGMLFGFAFTAIAIGAIVALVLIVKK